MATTTHEFPVALKNKSNRLAPTQKHPEQRCLRIEERAPAAPHQRMGRPAVPAVLAPTITSQAQQQQQQQQRPLPHLPRSSPRVPPRATPGRYSRYAAGLSAVVSAVLESRQAAVGESGDPHGRVVIVEFLQQAGPTLFACALI